MINSRPIRRYSGVLCTGSKDTPEVYAAVYARTSVDDRHDPRLSTSNQVQKAKALAERARLLVRDTDIYVNLPGSLRPTRWKTRKVTVVLIDEQLRPWEAGTYTRSEIESALGLAGCETRKILSTLDDACNASGAIYVQNIVFTGVGVMPSNEGSYPPATFDYVYEKGFSGASTSTVLMAGDESDHMPVVRDPSSQ